jgi:hypothetical protein
MCLPMLARTVLSGLHHTCHIFSRVASWGQLAAVGRGLLQSAWGHLCGFAARAHSRMIVRLARRSSASQGHCCGGRKGAAAEHSGLPCEARHQRVCPCPTMPAPASCRPVQRRAARWCRSRGQTTRATNNKLTAAGGGREPRVSTATRVARGSKNWLGGYGASSGGGGRGSASDGGVSVGGEGESAAPGDDDSNNGTMYRRRAGDVNGMRAPRQAR